jgi:hypothetical protein
MDNRIFAHSRYFTVFPPTPTQHQVPPSIRLCAAPSSTATPPCTLLHSTLIPVTVDTVARQVRAV